LSFLVVGKAYFKTLFHFGVLTWWARAIFGCAVQTKRCATTRSLLKQPNLPRCRWSDLCRKWTMAAIGYWKRGALAFSDPQGLDVAFLNTVRRGCLLVIGAQKTKCGPIPPPPAMPGVWEVDGKRRA